MEQEENLRKEIKASRFQRQPDYKLLCACLKLVETWAVPLIQ